MERSRRNPFSAFPAILVATSLLAYAGSASAGLPGTDVFIPASARAPGQLSAQFYSTLWITNLTSSAPANVQLRFFQRDTSNTAPISVSATIAPGETKKYENVVETLFGLHDASGAIRILSDQQILASSRTYNLPPGANLRDANGLFFTGIPQSLAIGSGESTQLQGISQGGSEDFRYNFGLVETAGAAATVRIVIRNPLGNIIGTKDYSVRPYEARQFPVTDVAPEISTDNGRIDAVVIGGSGAVLVYGTGIANGSQDSIGFEMSYRNPFLSAGVTSLNGLSGIVALNAGTNVTITTLGNAITISSAGGGGGSLTLPFSGSASTVGGEAAFTVGNSGNGSGIFASANIAPAIVGAVPGQGGYDRAVVGTITSTAPAAYSAGVKGENLGTGPNGIGVYGSHTAGGWGVYGESVSGRGVYGVSTSGQGVYGYSASDVGVYGTSVTAYGVLGKAEKFGLKGQQGQPSGSPLGTNKGGIWGDSVDGYGVYGTSTNGVGLAGISQTRYGVQALGYASSITGAALYAFSFAGTDNVAGYFGGAVSITGSLTKGGGAFKIDHPLDPENKYLYHSFVESPDMMNIYNGVAVLDGRGEASVVLPPWFSTLNRDFRYQLTCIGGYAPVYISREVENSAFQIAGGKPGLKVSWQITGIRQDAWANANRIPVEEAKPSPEKGHYLHPAAFGQPDEKGEDWAREPERMKELKALREASQPSAPRR